MIVNDLKETKKGYIVTIDDKEYKFQEDTIVDFRLVKGKEITKEILNDAIKAEDLNYYYNKALDYHIRYMKGRSEIYTYLIKKGISPKNANTILDKLENSKVLNDKNVIESLIRTYIKDKNGILMIKEKLKSKGFDTNDIEDELSKIDLDIYYECLESLYQKIKDKYNKYDDYIRINKIKAYLLQRGYTYQDINTLDIK